MDDERDIHEQPEEQGERRFTQADIDRVVGKRLAEERAKYPSAEEMTAYNNWKASQQTEAEKLAGIVSERDAAKSALASANAQIADMNNERYLLAKGLTGNDLEFAKFMINKMVSDSKTFEQAAEEYFKENEVKPRVQIDTSGSLGGSSKKSANAHDQFNARLRRGK